MNQYTRLTGMPRFVRSMVTVALLCLPLALLAEIIDPETLIQKNGYQSVQIGDDGKMPFYSFTERTDPARIATLEREIALLPKDEKIFKSCDFVRGGTKAKLIESTRKAIDVVVSNYGYKGATVACSLKFMYGGEVGTQLIYMKTARGSTYMVFVTH
ncbi:hypothetical protein [Rhodoferax sediminis]|jgi:hypothetical protein|uniref:Uncharacterized protein n=1 Tax=Rhodoferax sediminis TaxID=2509614 RepID=A0A515DAM9_9BURK|nr:hypothetical protein [Rhodoferax sediminis]QDL37459.1 hypothetical protein EUB48_09370 [Rhodoferax sediminis]